MVEECRDYGQLSVASGAHGFVWASECRNRKPVIAGPLFRFDLQTNTRSPAVAAEILRRRIADGRRLLSTRAQERYALIPIVSTPLYAPEAPPVTIGVCAAICLGVLSAKTSSRSTLTEVKFAALAP